MPASKDYSAKSSYQGDVARNYLGRRNQDIKWQIEQNTIGQIISNLPSDSVILDIPIGTGRFLHSYARCGHTVYGLDVSCDMLQEVKLTESSKIILIQGEAECIPLAKDSVDYVMCVRLLNWIPTNHLKTLLTEFRRVGRKGCLLHIRMVDNSTKTSTRIKKMGIEIWQNPFRSISRLLNSIVIVKRIKEIVRGNAGLLNDYVYHDMEILFELLTAQGFVVEEVLEIDDGTAFTRKLGRHTPLRLYRIHFYG